MKRAFECAVTICFIAILIIFCADFCFGEVIREGAFEFGAIKNNITQLESFNTDLSLNFRNNLEGTGVKIGFKLNKEQDQSQLTEMDIKSTLQGDFYIRPKTYIYCGLDYKRNIAWSIDDFTSLGAGIGYQPSNDFIIQCGVSWATLYSNFMYDRQSLAVVETKIKQKLYDPFFLQFEVAGELNMEEIHALNDFFNDYLTETKTSLIGKITEKVFISIFYEWNHKHIAPSPRDQRIAGLNFGLKL